MPDGKPGQPLWRRVQRWLGVDGNPLRRRSDRVESAAKVMACVLMGLVVAPAVYLGQLTYHQEQRAAAVYPIHHDRIEALLLADAHPAMVGSSPAEAIARWTGPDGSHRTGAVPADTGAHSGERVPIWVDTHGVLANAPPGEVEIATNAVLIGLGVVVGSLLPILLVYALMRRVLDARRARRWAAQWEQVSGRWTSSR